MVGPSHKNINFLLSPIERTITKTLHVFVILFTKSLSTDFFRASSLSRFGIFRASQLKVSANSFFSAVGVTASQ